MATYARALVFGFELEMAYARGGEMMRVQPRRLLAKFVMVTLVSTTTACAFDSSGSATGAGSDSGSESDSETGDSDSATETSGSDATTGTASDSASSTDPTTDGPTTDGPTTGDPTTEDPTTEDPTTEDPTTEDPTTEDPTDDPTTEDPTTEDPTTDTGCEPVVWYEDSDGDGFGDPDAPTESCDQPEGYVDNALDCRDKGDGAEVMSPDHVEVCDDFDNDCDGVVNEFSGDNGQCAGCSLGQFEGSVYFFCGDSREWGAARDFCADRFGPLVDLVVIEDGTENSYVQDSVGFGNWWIGLTDQANEGTWVWVDDSALEFEDWGWMEPNDLLGEDCVETDDSRWRDSDCGGNSRFVCEGPA